MTPEEVQTAVAAGAVVLDMRPPKPFATEHIPGAVNFQFNRADLADRAEMALPTDVQYVIHAEPAPIAKVAVEIMTKAGFRVLGWLEGGLKQWKEAGFPTAELGLMTVDELHADLDQHRVVDTREGFEYSYGHIPGSQSIVWTEPWSTLEAVEDNPPLAIVCGDQVRSCYVASVMRRAGKDARLVFGGMVDWLERGFPVQKTAKETA